MPDDEFRNIWVKIGFELLFWGTILCLVLGVYFLVRT